MWKPEYNHWLFKFLIVLVIVIYSFFSIRNADLNSSRTEVRVMLSYLASLQKAHFLDKGEYVYFDSWYGAPDMGIDRCTPSSEAEELGFSLDHCDSKVIRKLWLFRDPGSLYAYRSLPRIQLETQTKGFVLEAMSGSDINGEDLVCGDVSIKDFWTLRDDSTYTNVRDCK